MSGGAGKGIVDAAEFRSGMRQLAASFAGMLGLQGEARCGAGAASWGMLRTGAPVLIGTAATFDCELVQEVELSSHVLRVGSRPWWSARVDFPPVHRIRHA